MQLARSLDGRAPPGISPTFNLPLLSLTSLLLLEGKVGPVALHAVAESHPELGLLLHGHLLPSLLNVGERGVGDGHGGSGADGHGGLGGANGDVAHEGRDGGSAKHGGGGLSADRD